MTAKEIVDIIRQNDSNIPADRLYVTESKDKFTIFDNYDSPYSCGLIYDSGKWHAHSNSMLARAPITEATALEIASNFFGKGSLLAEDIVADHIAEEERIRQQDRDAD
tara:strand:+ start:208 stop:531 length:324 start_codon:yes stop_codon:yes gene_type:complete